MALHYRARMIGASAPEVLFSQQGCHESVKAKVCQGPTPEVRRARSNLRFGQEFVFVDHSSHGDFAVAIINAHNFPFTADPDAFSQGDFRREGQSELNDRSGGDGGIHVKANPARTHIVRLSALFLRSVVRVRDGHGQPQGKAARSTFFWFGLGHERSVKTAIAWRLGSCVSRQYFGTLASDNARMCMGRTAGRDLMR